MSFKVVEETEVDESEPAPESNVTAQALAVLLTGLSQKALIAISNLFTALALFSAWWLWQGILEDPTVLKLIGVGLYATFILVLEIVRRRK